MGILEWKFLNTLNDGYVPQRCIDLYNEEIDQFQLAGHQLLWVQQVLMQNVKHFLCWLGGN